MTDRCFYKADGEMLIEPQRGRARFVTELDVVEAASGEIIIMPRGLRFRVELPDGPSARLYLRELRRYAAAAGARPARANGANPRDFLTPVAAYEDVKGPFSLVAKFREISGRRR